MSPRLTRSAEREHTDSADPAAPLAPRGGDAIAAARERFEKRAAAARRRPKLVFAALAGTVLIGLLLGWLLAFSSVFAATGIRVQGVTGADATAVSQAARLLSGQPLARVDTAAMAARVQALGFVQSVEVDRAYPHTVVVTVVPRRPIAAISRPGFSTALIGTDGVIFTRSSAAPTGLPTVTAEMSQPDSDAVKAVAEVLALPSSLRSAISELRIVDGNSLTFKFKVKDPAGTSSTVKSVVWGSSGDAALKGRLVGILAKQPVNSIDVSVPSTPVTR